MILLVEEPIPDLIKYKIDMTVKQITEQIALNNRNTIAFMVMAGNMKLKLTFILAIILLLPQGILAQASAPVAVAWAARNTDVQWFIWVYNCSDKPIDIYSYWVVLSDCKNNNCYTRQGGQISFVRPRGIIYRIMPRTVYRMLAFDEPSKDLIPEYIELKTKTERIKIKILLEKTALTQVDEE